MLAVLLGVLTFAHRYASPVASARCDTAAGAGFYVGWGSTAELLKASPVIVYGSVRPEEFSREASPLRHGATPSVTVERVLNGNGIKSGDVMELCPDQNLPGLPDGKHPKVVVFLEGKDKRFWVPGQGGLGILPAEQSGDFDLQRLVTNGPVLNLQGVVQLVRQ